MGLQRFAKPFTWLIIATGAAVCLFSAYYLSVDDIDARFLLLAIITIGFGSSLGIQIPRVKGQISFADTFIFLTMLLYDGEAAILLAAAEALCSSLRISRKAITIKTVTILFNSAAMACSTFITVWVLRFCFNSSIKSLADDWYSATFVIALCTMALVQYIVNSSLVALHTAFKTNQPAWHTWSRHYLWASITYFVGASAAGGIVKLVKEFHLSAVILTIPIIVAVYFTYRRYIEDIKASAAQAEQAERARAEQAEQHVAELSRYIAEQERIREQLSQMEKLSALGELASGVAHDFNNILAGILGRAQLLMRTRDPVKIKRGLEIIVKAAEDGAHTVRRIQDFARLRRDHEFVPVDVDQVLVDVSEITRPRWQDWAAATGINIRLELRADSDSVVMGDASELREVLVNMVFNAVGAMPTGGRLVLAAEKLGPSVVISISDTGIGMSTQVRSRIFDPFFTTKGTAGMGLGLAVSYGIIRRHEGTIEVESELGRGTTFSIRLPVAEGLTVASAKDELSAFIAKPLPLAQRTRILVVDDEAFIGELLREVLESEGYEAVVAAGGREALALFDEGDFDAVFTDVGMPGMSGWELARAVRKRSSSVPVAVITGWGEAVGSEEQRAAQVDWVVTKPFTADRIAELAQEVSRQRNVNLENAILSNSPNVG
ncbi:MAG: response regulator [Pyrinomonadaceae bacterium]|nr:response regulator [Pyrinomonadaceae bacterium]